MIFRALQQAWLNALTWGFAALLLSGCGGGSSSTNSTTTPNNAPTPSPAQAAITVAPTSVSVETTQGSGGTFTLTMTINKQIVTGTAYLALDDSMQVIAQYNILSSTSTTATVSFQTSTTLTVGDHAGSLNFYACEDDECATTYSQTPATVQYDIKVDPAPPAATLTPNAINLTVQQGDPASIVLDAVINSNVSVQGFALNDSQGRFSSAVNYVFKSANDDAVTLNLLAVTDTPGTYSGTVNLQLCDSYNCADQDNVLGSPISIPYTITVTPFVPLAAIPTTTGLPEWETFQGNAGHTGYVPVTLDANTFASKWTWTFTANDGNLYNLSPVTTGSGDAVLAVSGYVSPASLIALNESDGSVAWQHNFGSIFAASDPAVFGGRAFLVTVNSDESANIQAFGISDGSPVFQSPITAQWYHYYAPTVKDGYVYTVGGIGGGLYAFNATTGVNKWFAPANQYDKWTPAVDGNYVYAYTGVQYSGDNDDFAVFNIKDGSKAFTVGKSDFNWNGWSMGIAPVLPGDNSILVVDGIDNFPHQNHLVRYGVQQQAILWEMNGAFVSNPVIASGTIYVLNAANNQLEARDEATGNALWTWQPTGSNETTPIGNLVLTNNLVFICSSTTTYAIDLTTHQSVWSVPHVGALALSSNKVLYISSPSDQTVYAYTLN